MIQLNLWIVPHVDLEISCIVKEVKLRPFLCSSFFNYFCFLFSGKGVVGDDGGYESPNKWNRVASTSRIQVLDVISLILWRNYL